MYDLDEVIRQRRSVRGFLDKPVPPELLQEALELANRTPSNCNVQPWRVFIAQGAACQRLRQALVAQVMSGEAAEPEDEQEVYPQPYRKLQIECAVEMFGHMQIARDDHAGRARALLRNFELFDAPAVAIVTMEKQFGYGVALTVGMWLQTFVLALWARGIGSCAQASLRQYPQLIRSQLGIRDDLRIICGLSFGYEDPLVPANRTRQARQPVSETVTILND